MKEIARRQIEWVRKRARFIPLAMLFVIIWGATNGFRSWSGLIYGWEGSSLILLWLGIIVSLFISLSHFFIKTTFRRFGKYGRVFAELGVRCPKCASKEILAGVNYFAFFLDVVGWRSYPMKCWNCGCEWRGNCLVNQYREKLARRGIKIKLEE